MRSLLLGLVVLLTSAALPARADDLTLEAAQRVITGQLEAFRNNDGATAYAFASPEVQAKFSSVELFMSMVRTGYAPVYAARQVQFAAGRIDDGVITQAVDIVAADGTDWVAVYTLAAMPDGSLKITSCRLVRRDGIGA